MISRIDDPIALKDLVSFYEENDVPLDEVPKKFIEKYGYGCLSNSLMFKEPTIPKCNKDIITYIDKHPFETVDSLVLYINSLDNDIDRLFAIFSYSSLNIQYDSKHKNSNFEEIFFTKRAVCSGFCLFFIEMAKRVNIDKNRIIIKEYSNLSKADQYNEEEPPTIATSDHSSIYISIDNIPFISEPTWASKKISENNKEIEREFKPEYFLIPLYKTLCYLYPCNGSKKLLPFEYKLKDFTNSIKINPLSKSVKTETNPFVYFKSSNGYICQTYSCNGPVDKVNFNIYVKNKDLKYDEISINGITSYEIIQMYLPKHHNRCRFKTYIILPNPGYYKIELFINTKFELRYYVNNLNPCNKKIPIFYNPFNDHHFISLNPKSVLSSVDDGIKIIRFVVSKKRSDFIYEIQKLDDEDSFILNGEIISNKKYSQYVTLLLPFDKDHFEIQLCITFPSNGRYSVSLFMLDDEDTYTFYVRYFIDVKGVNSNEKNETNPIYYSSFCKGRKFAPAICYDKEKNPITFIPNQNCFYVTKRDQSLQIKTASINDKIHFELHRKGKSLLYADEEGVYEDFRNFKWIIPFKHGEYHLIGWINDYKCIDLTYIYDDLIFTNPKKFEKEMMGNVKEKLIQINSSIKIINEENEKNQLVETNVEQTNDDSNSVRKVKANEIIYENECLKKENDDLKNENVYLHRENESLRQQILMLKKKMSFS